MPVGSHAATLGPAATRLQRRGQRLANRGSRTAHRPLIPAINVAGSRVTTDSARVQDPRAARGSRRRRARRARGRNQRALLALLLLRANEPVSTRAARRPALGRAPAAHGDDLAPERGRRSCASCSGPAAPDPADRLRARARRRPARPRALRAARRGRHARPSRPSACCSSREALELWRGPPLADLESGDVRAGGDPRGSRICGSPRSRSGSQPTSSSARTPSSCAEIEALVRAHPLRERPARPPDARALPCGRQAEALAAYHDARRTLVEELGIEPGPELQALYGSILRQERDARPRRGAGARGSLRRGDPGASRPAGSCRCSAPVSGECRRARAGATLLAERFELDDDGRGLAYVSQAVAARNGSARCTTSSTSRSTATSSRRRSTPGSPACRRCSAAARCRSS